MIQVLPGDFGTGSWIQQIRTAWDRHEQNVQVVREGEELMARTMKSIQAGQVLCLWYSDQLALELGVPILTPSNIRGYQDYQCSHCHAVFRHPNSLKAHLMHACSSSTFSRAQHSSTLVPFQLLLKTLSRSAQSVDTQHNKLQLAQSIPPSDVTSPRTCSSTPSHATQDAGLEHELAHKSAFKSPSRPQKDSVSDDGFMTPDSSTDKQTAFHLPAPGGSLTPHGISLPTGPSLAHHWSAVAAQQNALLTRRFHIPYSYSQVQPYFPLQPHFHNVGLQFLQYTRPRLMHSDVHALGSLLETGNRAELIATCSSQRESKADILSLRAPRPCPPPLSPSARQTRPENHYAINLPSDKEPLDLLPQAYFANKSKRGHLCLYCGKLYSRKYGLKIHMRTHNGYKPLKCKICSRPFGDPSNLNKHVRLHAQGDTPYRCEFCGKVLVRRRDLERHIKSRHPMGNLQAQHVTREGEEGEGEEEEMEEEEEEPSPDSSPISVASHEEESVTSHPVSP